MVVLILVAICCAPGIAGRSLRGFPAPAVHVNPRPSPGDCLAPLDSPEQLNSVFDVVPVVPCSAAHSAEVLTVGTLDSRSWPTRPSVDDSAFTNGPLSQRCDRLAGK